MSFIERMLERLAPLAKTNRLGPVLLQLPPNLRRDDDRLQTFLDHLPKDIRWAIEFRHASWNVPEVETLLRVSGIAWAAADTDETPAEPRDTAAFCYVRLRRSTYNGTELKQWAGLLMDYATQGRECFVFFKHEDQGSPWIWADQLTGIIGRSRDRSASF